MVVNIMLFSVIFYFTLTHGLPWLVDLLTPEMVRFPEFFRILFRLLIWVVSLILIGLLGVVSFTSVGMVLAAPFNDLLSEWVEGDLLGQAIQRPLTLANLLQDLGRTVWQAARKMLVVMAVFCCSLPLLVIPIAGPVLYTALNSVVATWYTALEYLDLPMARIGWGLKRRRAWAWDRQTPVFGFGMGVYMTMLVPMLGFLVMPAAVAGATILFVELGDPRDSRSETTSGDRESAEESLASASAEDLEV
jgi:CysZ protein